MRLGIAARQSQLKDGQTGIESSDAACIEMARREGHEVVFIAADHKSGTTHPWDRPNLRPWVTEPGKIAQYDGILAYRFDRLSRGDDRSTSMIEAWAYENGKQLLTEDGLKFPCEGADGIRWDVTKRIAHEEWLKTSERYKRMTAFLRSGGFHVGRAPFGYQSVPSEVDPRHKALAIEPVEASVVRDVAEWYLGGMSLDAIAARLNEAGRGPRKTKRHPNPQWQASNLSTMLHNEAIAGRQKSVDGYTIQKTEPILSREIWEAVIGRMDKRKTRKAISQSKAPALLTSIIVCTACDKPMYRTGRWNSGIGYYCRVKGCRSYAPLAVADGMVQEAMTEDHERDVIETLVPGSGHDAEIAEVKRDLAEAVEAERFESLSTLRKELDRLRALPASPPRIERRESDLTVAEMWAAMPDDTARRAYLLERGACVEYGTDEDGRTYLLAAIGRIRRVMLIGQEAATAVEAESVRKLD